MHSAANAFAGFHGLSAAKLKGSARGALICTSFGSAWMYWVVVLSGSQTPVWFSIVTLLSVVLTLWSVLRVRAFRHLSSSPAEAEQWMRFRKLFWIDSCIEWGLGGIAVFLLAHIGRSDLVPQVFGVIVGLHFLPLAKVFSAHDSTGRAASWCLQQLGLLSSRAATSAMLSDVQLLVSLCG